MFDFVRLTLRYGAIAGSEPSLCGLTNTQIPIPVFRLPALATDANWRPVALYEYTLLQFTEAR